MSFGYYFLSGRGLGGVLGLCIANGDFLFATVWGDACGNPVLSSPAPLGAAGFTLFAIAGIIGNFAPSASNGLVAVNVAFGLSACMFRSLNALSWAHISVFLGSCSLRGGMILICRPGIGLWGKLFNIFFNWSSLTLMPPVFCSSFDNFDIPSWSLSSWAFARFFKSSINLSTSSSVAGFLDARGGLAGLISSSVVGLSGDGGFDWVVLNSKSS